MNDAMPVRRRDDESEWHDLLPGRCENCGCEYYFATDDPAMVWEPGVAWEETCRDRACRCHTEALIGVRRG